MGCHFPLQCPVIVTHKCYFLTNLPQLFCCANSELPEPQPRLSLDRTLKVFLLPVSLTGLPGNGKPWPPPKPFYHILRIECDPFHDPKTPLSQITLDHLLLKLCSITQAAFHGLIHSHTHTHTHKRSHIHCMASDS